ncbi:MAG: aminoglycoside phosphotransferase family protein [Ilumatobacteraceae bacterium]|nr:aminoglycoside phosphotransferase family protein [Ilumatobacteraceae bacterium]
MRIQPSNVLRNKAIAAGATEWLGGLPDLVDTLASEWGFSVGDAFADGTEAFVAAVTMDDGGKAVLKLLVPRPDAFENHEITVLQLANGDGCVALLRADRERRALLLERLGPSLHDLRLPLAQRHEILCDTASAFWRPAEGSGLRSGAVKGQWLIDSITNLWPRLGQPCSPGAVAHAIDCARRRIAAHDDQRAVLVHGDVHEWNVLQAGDGFKLIDPDGLIAEPEYDLGIIMREDADDLLAAPTVVDASWQRAHWLADRCGLDAVATWEWGVVERVSTGLLATSLELQPFGRDMLAVADALAVSHRP